MKRAPFNLIVTHYPGYDNYVAARHQLFDVLGRAMVVDDTSYSIMLLLVDDPYEAVEKIKRDLPVATPVLRVVPVDAVVDVYVDRVGPAARDKLYEKSRDERETFAVRVDGRLYERGEGGVIVRLSTPEAVRAVASYIDRPVNLSSPDWLVYVKTVRMYKSTNLAAVTVARPDQIFSSVKRSAAR
ncbi:MAG: THUMP domain-containing protein [Fervidicoccaceae archaeon]